MKVIKDTVVVVGDGAVKRGVAIRIVAAVILVLAVSIGIMISLLLDSIANQQISP